MTSDDHPTLDELAELDEGILAPERELAVRAHLDTCSDCRHSVDALAQTKTALHSLGPVAMPAEVAARIDQALAAAASAEPEAAPKTGSDVIPNLADVRRRRRLPTAPASAAAALVILAVVAIVIGFQHKSKPTIQESVGSGAGGSVAPLVGTGTQSLNAPGATAASFSVQSTDRLYTAATLDSLVPRLAHGSATGEDFSGVQPSTLPSAPSSGTNSANGTSPTTGQGTSLLPSGKTAGGAKQVVPSPSTAGKGPKHHPRANLPAGSAAGTRPDSGATGSGLPASLQPYQDNRQKVLDCAAFMTNTAGATPLAVDLGRWSDPTSGTKNIPAIIMLFSVPGDTTKDLVVVAAPPCGEGDLLKYESVDRPS